LEGQAIVALAVRDELAEVWAPIEFTLLPNLPDGPSSPVPPERDGVPPAVSARDTTHFTKQTHPGDHSAEPQPASDTPTMATGNDEFTKQSQRGDSHARIDRRNPCR